MMLARLGDLRKCAQLVQIYKITRFSRPDDGRVSGFTADDGEFVRIYARVASAPSCIRDLEADAPARC